MEKIKETSVVFSIQERKDTLFIGSAEGVYYLVERDDAKYYEIKGWDHSKYRIQDLESNGDILYIATRGNGLYYLQNNKIYSFSAQDGLPSNLINHIMAQDDKLWVATNKGSVCITVHEDSVHVISNLNVSNGLVAQDVRQVFLNKDKILFGTDNGISILDQSKSLQLDSLNMILNSISVDGEIIINDRNEFKYFENRFQFDFYATGLLSSSELIYSYRLEGIDIGWKQTKNRSVEYNNLAPGDYNFQVQVLNNQAHSSLIRSFSFTVLKTLLADNAL